jgi:hypothetical protein
MPTRMTLITNLTIFCIILLVVIRKGLELSSYGGKSNINTLIFKEMYILIRNIIKNNTSLKRYQYFSTLFFLSFLALITNLIRIKQKLYKKLKIFTINVKFLYSLILMTNVDTVSTVTKKSTNLDNKLLIGLGIVGLSVGLYGGYRYYAKRKAAKILEPELDVSLDADVSNIEKEDLIEALSDQIVSLATEMYNNESNIDLDQLPDANAMVRTIDLGPDAVEVVSKYVPINQENVYNAVEQITTFPVEHVGHQLSCINDIRMKLDIFTTVNERKLELLNPH